MKGNEIDNVLREVRIARRAIQNAHLFPDSFICEYYGHPGAAHETIYVILHRQNGSCYLTGAKPMVRYMIGDHLIVSSKSAFTEAEKLNEHPAWSGKISVFRQRIDPDKAERFEIAIQGAIEQDCSTKNNKPGYTLDGITEWAQTQALADEGAFEGYLFSGKDGELYSILMALIES